MYSWRWQVDDDDDDDDDEDDDDDDDDDDDEDWWWRLMKDEAPLKPKFNVLLEEMVTLKTNHELAIVVSVVLGWGSQSRFPMQSLERIPLISAHHQPNKQPKQNQVRGPSKSSSKPAKKQHPLFCPVFWQQKGFPNLLVKFVHMQTLPQFFEGL